MNIFDNFIDPFAGVATTFRQESVIKLSRGRGSFNWSNHMQEEMWGPFPQRQSISLYTINQKFRAVLSSPKDFVSG